jgi:hypothetical protein
MTYEGKESTFENKKYSYTAKLISYGLGNHHVQFVKIEKDIHKIVRHNDDFYFTYELAEKMYEAARIYAETVSKIEGVL